MRLSGCMWTTGILVSCAFPHKRYRNPFSKLITCAQDTLPVLGSASVLTLVPSGISFIQVHRLNRTTDFGIAANVSLKRSLQEEATPQLKIVSIAAIGVWSNNGKSKHYSVYLNLNWMWIVNIVCEVVNKICEGNINPYLCILNDVTVGRETLALGDVISWLSVIGVISFPDNTDKILTPDPKPDPGIPDPGMFSPVNNRVTQLPARWRYSWSPLMTR